MTTASPMVEQWRGPFLESVHYGHAVVCNAQGEITHVWGDPNQIILPRSSAKMLQALPLIESGAAEAFRLTPAQLALACASHEGAEIHVNAVNAWLSDLSLTDDALRCGPQPTRDTDLHAQMIRNTEPTCQVHNNCSGKHAGFLTLAAHLDAGPEYIELDHPVQRAVLDVWERMTQETVAGHGIDGCSAPNFATTLHGFARALATVAAASSDSAPGRLAHAMMAYPELVAGKDRACTYLTQALDGQGAVKTGAEGVFAAILPNEKLGIAVKIVDGATRASECAMTAILAKLGVLDANHPHARRYLNAPITNWRGIQTGWQRAAPPLC